MTCENPLEPPIKRKASLITSDYHGGTFPVKVFAFTDTGDVIDVRTYIFCTDKIKIGNFFYNNYNKSDRLLMIRADVSDPLEAVCIDIQGKKLIYPECGNGEVPIYVDDESYQLVIPPIWSKGFPVIIE